MPNIAREQPSVGEHSAIGRVGRTSNGRSSAMKKLILPLAIGAGALFASAASAAPLSNGLAVMPDNGIENVRMVCDEFGRCYRTRGGTRVIYGNSYGYAPGYYGGPGYYRGGYGPGVSVGIGPVGRGGGVGPRW